ncbi:MAG: S-layer homology domain-containing protein [Ruminococcaceae bacterium]|nr:S-layer homology domain-containing protein [Oscillospiraceae bacterium]
MKKKLLALLLAACIAVSMLVLPASAANNNTAVQFAVTLGAMDNTQTGALNAAVTRGAFARMLVAFSTFRESVGAQGTVGTLYTDVPGTSPWAPYIRIAVQQGWLNGYTDGSYRPDNAVTLEEACTAVLKLMGYKMTELNGSFPNAQLNKASEIGLRTNLERKPGEAMNYQDCAALLYNALTANTASGSAYGTSLGFTVSNGQVDGSTVLMSSLQGPFVAGADTQLPFAPVAVYRNDKVSPSAELNQYDVYYYSESLQTVWIYTRKAAGRITAVSPSASAPTAITVAGSSYTLGSTAVASQVSSLNGGGVGQVVTLLLGMNNEAAGIVTGKEADEVFYGVVQSATRSLVEENGADVLQNVSVMCTDGITRSVNVDKSLNFPTGWLVQITVNSDGESVKSISGKSTSGTVNADATALGNAQLADDVEILDTTSGGVAGTVRPSRLSGVTLSDSDVRYYTTNAAGQIDRLILKDVTGDLWKYGVLDDIKNLAANYADIKTLLSSSNTGTNTGTGTGDIDVDAVVNETRNLLVPTTSEILWGVVSGDILSTSWDKLTGNTAGLLGIGFRQIGNITGAPYNKIFNFIGGGATYVCFVNGQQTALTTSIKYPVLAGGIAVSQETSGAVKKMVQLMPMRIDKVGAASVLSSGGNRYEMADDAQVYLWYKGQYYATKLTSVNSDDYYLTGWYDNFGCTAGKKVRVIIAVKKD